MSAQEVSKCSRSSSEQDSRKLGDSSVPRIFFADWNETSRKAYLKAAQKNMEELQLDYDRRNARLNTFMIVNGTVLGLVLAFMVNSKLLERPELLWIGGIMITGFAFLLVSFILSIWTSSGTKDAPVMDFWIGTNPDVWDVIDDPTLLAEDLMNGFLMRCVDLKDTLERIVDKIRRCGRIFSAGLIILMISVVLALLYAPGSV